MLCRLPLLTAALVATLAVGLGSADHDHLRGFSVIRATPRNPDQQRVLHQYLQDNPQLDVWAETKILGRSTDVSLSPQQRQKFVAFLQREGVEHEDMIADLHSAVNNHLASLRKPDEDTPFNFTAYFRVERINRWMESLAVLYPDKVSVVTAGESYEGRPIKGAIIKFGENRPVALIESGIHAREWIAHATATFFIERLLSGDAADIVQKYEWHIFPSVNPDGYAYTWDTDRNWRKTRSKQWLLFRGADANRNWPFHWGEAGASLTPTAEDYAGGEAESEPETQAMRRYVDKLAERIHVYIGLHSYSQLLMFPWGYTGEHIPTHQKLRSIANFAVEAIEAVNGKEFGSGNIADTIYVASGSTIDYAFSKCIPFPFVFELRDNGAYGFLLPEDQILDAALEAWAGVKVIVDEAFKDGVPEKNPSVCNYYDDDWP